MPQVTVYIRLEDHDKWKQIEKKSLFIHKALQAMERPRVVLKGGEPDD